MIKGRVYVPTVTYFAVNNALNVRTRRPALSKITYLPRVQFRFSTSGLRRIPVGVGRSESQGIHGAPWRGAANVRHSSEFLAVGALVRQVPPRIALAPTSVRSCKQDT
jgi:hypothetical protein